MKGQVVDRQQGQEELEWTAGFHCLGVCGEQVVADGLKGGVCVTGRKLEIQKWGQRFLVGRKARLCQTVTGSGWVQPEGPQAESPSFGAGKGDSDLSHTGIMAAAWHEA